MSAAFPAVQGGGLAPASTPGPKQEPAPQHTKKRAARRVLPGFRLTLSYTLLYLVLIVLVPLAAVFQPLEQRIEQHIPQHGQCRQQQGQQA